jgi:hypothetical protein
MKRDAKPSVALAGALLISATLCGTANAQSTLIESGTSTLADLFGVSTGSEALTVSWFVVENTGGPTSGTYTYAYNVSNPTGDVVLNPNGTLTTTPESFNSFSITFNTGLAANLVLTPPAGGSVQNNMADGVTFSFPDVAPGSSSPLLAFQTTTAPALVMASAGGGATPPGPWSTVPNNSPVPAPRGVPEPGTATLMALTALGLPIRFISRRLNRSRE